MPNLPVLAACLGQQPPISVPLLASSLLDSLFDPSLPYDHLFPPSSILPPCHPNTNPWCNTPLSSNPCLTPVPSSLVADAWDYFLHDYPDRQFVALLLHIIKFDTNVGFIGQLGMQSCKNLKSALENEELLSESIKNLVTNGHLAGPYSTPPLPDLHCSPVGVISRNHKPGKLWVINHLSWPKGSLVNDGIPDEEASISYDMFEHAIGDLLASGQGSLMAKLDLKDAFWHISFWAQDWNLLGIDWGCRFYFLLVLAFSLKMEPYIFNLFGEALHWIIQHHIPTALCHYLNDFLLIFQLNSQMPVCMAAVNWVMSLGQKLGLCFQDSKTIWPCMTLEFLSLEIDSVAMEAHLPQEKLVFLCYLLTQWSVERKCTLLKLQKLTGFLQFASQVIPRSCSYL